MIFPARKSDPHIRSVAPSKGHFRASTSTGEGDRGDIHLGSVPSPSMKRCEDIEPQALSPGKRQALEPGGLTHGLRWGLGGGVSS